MFKSWVELFNKKKHTKNLPLSGFPPTLDLLCSQLSTMPDQEIEILNKLLPWQASTIDSRGRRLGNIAWKGKRDVPESIDDYRATILKKYLHHGSVLEIGCFEGIHTLSLLRQGYDVTAIDSRVENVVKSIVRVNMYGYRPVINLFDIDGSNLPSQGHHFDGCFHCGVLYHLKNPIEHLNALLPKISKTLLLDTHVASEQDCVTSYHLPYENVKCKIYAESGRSDVFSGMHPHAKWLSLETIKNILLAGGFSSINLIESRNERNGLRVLLVAQKS